MGVFPQTQPEGFTKAEEAKERAEDEEDDRLAAADEPTEADLAPWDATAADADELPWESDEAVARHVSPHVGACAPWRGEVRDT